MKKLDTIYKIEVTAEEVEAITTALHGEYKFIKDMRTKAETPEKSQELYNKMELVRSIRNNFADICNRRYMGEDA